MSLKVKRRGTKFRKAHTVTCVSIPLPPLHKDEERAQENPVSTAALPPSNPLLSKKTPLHIFETDPAQLELAKAQEAKRKRESAEMILALEKIQKRIEYTIREYEGLSNGDQDPPGEEVATTGVNLEVIEDANQLFALLTDPTIRSKYHQKLTVFLIGYEEKKEALEGVLGQLRDFFLENQAGGTEELLQEVEGEEIDLDEATRDLDAALGKAQDSVRKLVGIKKEMSHLVSIVAAYPNTNKGRKQMEKSLLKAQEEVEVLSKNLDEVQGSLKQSSDKCSQLQVQLDAKTKDCAELRKTADQAKLLQVSNEKLKGDLVKAEKDLKESREEVGRAKSQLITAQAEAQSKGSLADKERAVELERQLEEERARSQSLQAELEALVQTHGEELEALKAEHEAESSEVRGRFEEQLKSLMGEDMFGEQEDLEEERESATEAVEPEGVDGDEVSLREVTPSPIEEAPREACDKLDDGSEAKGVADSPEAEQQIEKLKREWETREKKALEQVEDIKSKSRKMVALLQSQLTDANSKAASTREKLEAEVTKLREELGQEKDRNEELLQALAALRDEVANLEESLRQKGEELEEAREELRAIVSSQQEEMSFLRSQMLSERPAMSPMQSLSTIPLRALEEEEGAAESSEDIEKSHVFPLSLEQSEISVDPVPLGSPLRSQVLSSAGSYMGAPRSSPPLQPSSSPPAQCSLSMLAMSRLSHHSSSLPQNQPLSHSHPVVVEWSKAYESVIKFKESLVEILREHQTRMHQFPELIQELQNMELHSLDRKQDVQGQMTEMRFSLVLFLHQLEQTLQEGFSLMLAEITACEEEAAAARKSAKVDRAPGSGAELTEQLKHIESHHREELERSKETIAQLSSQVESLRIQLGQLQNAVSSREERSEGTIMFTRLDSERNTKALQSALEKEQLSPATFSQLVEEMEDYLSLPTKRLVVMSRRWQEKNVATKLVQQMQQRVPGACPSSAQALSRVVEGVAELEEDRQRQFKANMERIGEMRTTLAHSLTTSLRQVEKETGEFLIKPVFTRSPPPPRYDLITPVPRPLPPPPAAPSRRQSAKAGRRPNTSHTATSSRAASSNIRLIQSFLHAHRQRADPQGLIQSVNSANSPTPRIKSSRQSHASLSGFHVTPPRHSSLAVPEGDWDVGSSSVPQGQGQARGGVESSISFSKMAELDISRHRQTDNLLGHVLPHMQPHNYTPLAASPTHLSRGHTPITGGMSRHLTPSPHKLRSLPEESGPSSHSSSTHSREAGPREGWVRPQLPPIDVPSRTDTLTVM